MSKKDFKSGLYTFFSSNEANYKNPFEDGRFEILNNSIVYRDENSRVALIEIFAEGPINLYTSGQLEKYLNKYHGYCWLEVSKEATNE